MNCNIDDSDHKGIVKKVMMVTVMVMMELMKTAMMLAIMVAMVGMMAVVRYQAPSGYTP